jgi:colanic acid/amylovoran biosynthesis glycosyltransferase
MRIAFLINEFPTLSETFILSQITGLIDRGHEVDIYCDVLGDTTTIHAEVEEYQLLERTYPIPTIPENFIGRIVKAFFLFIRNFLKAPKILLKAANFVKYNYWNYGDPACFLQPIHLVIPWLDKSPDRYNIIFCHYGRNGLKANLLKNLGVIQGKIVVVFHGYDISSYIEIHGKNIYDRLFDRVELLQPISQHWQKKLISLGCNSDRIQVHRMGIDCSKFQYQIRQTNPSIFHLVSIARLVEKKGLQYSIQAVAKLIPHRPNLQYQIVGDGILKAELQQLIEELNVSNNIKLLGWKTQQEISTIMKDADILLAPSVTSQDGNCEGIPMCLMEAMAKGLPVISTYHSGIPELIEDGRSGYLLPEREINDLASKIEHLILNPELRLTMGQAGRQKIETEYNIELLNDRLERTLQQLIN